jgi:DNA-binding GntR family transcriptional regulator
MAILDCVAARDVEGAKQAMRDHLGQVETEIPQIAREPE